MLSKADGKCLKEWLCLEASVGITTHTRLPFPAAAARPWCCESTSVSDFNGKEPNKVESSVTVADEGVCVLNESDAVNADEGVYAWQGGAGELETNGDSAKKSATAADARSVDLRISPRREFGPFGRRPGNRAIAAAGHGVPLGAAISRLVIED